MAAYGSGPYGGGNYSFGISLGEASIEGVSSVGADGLRIAIGDVAVNSESSVVVDGVRVAFMSATVAINAEMVVGANVIVNRALSIYCASQLGVSGSRVRNFGFNTRGASSATCFARLKWEQESDTNESWSEIADGSTTWTPIADTTETWQIAA